MRNDLVCLLSSRNHFDAPYSEFFSCQTLYKNSVRISHRTHNSRMLQSDMDLYLLFIRENMISAMLFSWAWCIFCHLPKELIFLYSTSRAPFCLQACFGSFFLRSQFICSFSLESAVVTVPADWNVHLCLSDFDQRWSIISKHSVNVSFCWAH